MKPRSPALSRALASIKRTSVEEKIAAHYPHAHICTTCERKRPKSAFKSGRKTCEFCVQRKKKKKK